jgi:Na+/proline symporter
MILANHMKGLCVVKKALSQVKSRGFMDKFKDLINNNTMALVHNPYGNYAIQTVLEVIKIFTFLFFYNLIINLNF